MNDASCSLVGLDALEVPKGTAEGDDVSGLARSLRALGRLVPLLARPSEAGVFRVVAGRRRVLAARKAGLALLPVRVLEGVDHALVRAAENSARRERSPSTLVESVRELAASRGVAPVAEALGMTAAQAENLVRLRNALGEEAWSAFRDEDHGRSLRNWLTLGSLPKDEQTRALAANGCTRAYARRTGAGRVRSARELEAVLRRLSVDDVRAKTIRWVLDAGPFPWASAELRLHSPQNSAPR